MDWTVYNFDCGTPERRDGFLEWVDDTHPTDIPADRDHVFEDIRVDDDRTRRAEFAWTGTYVYMTVLSEAGSLFEDTTQFWDRAVIAEFDSTTETCTEAVLYRCDDDAPVEVARYEGISELGGQDMLYRFAMDHQFRFRALCTESPTTQLTPHPGAFDFLTEWERDDESIQYFADETGVEPTREGLAFLRDDPERDDDGS